MTESNESRRDKLIVATVQTLIFGALLAVLGFWLNVRLEDYKRHFADDTERLKSALQSNGPLIQQRVSGYHEIKLAARNLNRVLGAYYFRAKGLPAGDVLEGQLKAVENVLLGDSGSSGGDVVTNDDVVRALRELVALREKYDDISSEKINAAIDQFLKGVMEDLEASRRKENQNESFDTAARTRLKDAGDRLNGEMNRALRVNELPIE